MTFKELVRYVVHEETKVGRGFNLVIKVLILMSLISISIETLPDISDSTLKYLALLETITVAIFTVEYLARIYASEKRLRFIFSFYGLIDLLAILPYYLVVGLDLRSLRVFRLFRVLRLLKFSRYSDAMDRLTEAFRIIRSELIVFLLLIISILYIAAVGIYYFENPVQPDVYESVFHSLWWAVITLTTVGYGDMYPLTFGGRLFTFVILMLGLAIMAVPTGLIASALTKTIEED